MFKYGVLESASVSVGSPVRYVEGPSGRTGVILPPRSAADANAVLLRAVGTMGYVRLTSSAPSVTSSADPTIGSASAINVDLPIQARGSLRVE